MRRSSMPMVAAALLAGGPPLAFGAEVLARAELGAARERPFVRVWGDVPAQITANCGAAEGGAESGRLDLTFGETPAKLSYWRIDFPEPVPILPLLEALSFRVRSNVPVSIKVPIDPFGFIYHGPGVAPSEAFQELRVAQAYRELSAWCARGERDVGQGLVPGLILAIGTSPGAQVRVEVRDVVAFGAEGAGAVVAAERQQRRFRRLRLSVVTLPWSPAGRSLATVLDRLDEAAVAGSDLVVLPMECVQSDGEAIPGPSSNAIAAKAAQHRMYVVGNLRERPGDGRTYVTSFLCDRSGAIRGRYRKSHKLPDEDMDLGDELPVFPTDLGPIAMRCGSDRYFADIDHVYAARGARVICWSQQPELVEDEHLQDLPTAGRAQDCGVVIACARYAFAPEGWITNFFPPYRGCPIGRSYVVDRDGQRVACTPRQGTVATAVLRQADLQRPGRSPNRNRAFAALWEATDLPAPRTYAKRVVRATCIENHVGIDDLLGKLDRAGEIGSDLVLTYEFVWIHGPNQTPADQDRVARETGAARENLRRIAEKARQWRMYVVVAGVIDRLERNEAICYGRDGAEVGRYFKTVRTHDEQICGDDTPIIETDFGRLGIRICADNALSELDRTYGVKGADMVLFATQDWGPDALHRALRETARSMDAQVFHVQATHASSEVMHRSVIIEPTGVTAASSQYLSKGLVSAVLDLDHDRPRRYVRQWTPHTPKGYLPQYQPTELPEVRNDLKETLLRQRRPELYAVLGPAGGKASAGPPQ